MSCYFCGVPNPRLGYGSYCVQCSTSLEGRAPPPFLKVSVVSKLKPQRIGERRRSVLNFINKSLDASEEDARYERKAVAAGLRREVRNGVVVYVGPPATAALPICSRSYVVRISCWWSLKDHLWAPFQSALGLAQGRAWFFIRQIAEKIPKECWGRFEACVECGKFRDVPPEIKEMCEWEEWVACTSRHWSEGVEKCAFPSAVRRTNKVGLSYLLCSHHSDTGMFRGYWPKSSFR